MAWPSTRYKTAATGGTWTPTDMNAIEDQFLRAGGILASDLDPAIDRALGINDGTNTRCGSSFVSTAETHTTGTAYGLLPTPDRVSSIVVAANALVYVQYQALWRASASSGPGRAAIFIGSNQLKAQLSGGLSPVTQAAAMGQSNISSTDTVLASFPNGLIGVDDAGSSAGNDVTTGQAAGITANAAAATEELNNTIFQLAAGRTPYGGACVIDNLAAGTYDFSVQFKATSGTVTVKNRRLRVWTRLV